MGGHRGNIKICSHQSQVMVNPGLDEIKRSNFQYDFDYEHKIAREYGIDDSHDSEDPSAHSSSASSRDLPSLQVRSPMAGWALQIIGKGSVQ